MDVKSALQELRKQESRKFKQTVDLIINLKGIDLRRESISTVISVPHKVKEKKVCAFFEKKSSVVDTITKAEFALYKEKKAMKNLVKTFDFFIATAPLMPQVAAAFGKILGPAGKMPSPQLGILAQDNDASVKAMLEKISKAIKLRVKEASIKLSIGNESMSDEQIIENFNVIYEGVTSALPKKKENVRKVMLKFTMTKPIKIEF